MRFLLRFDGIRTFVWRFGRKLYRFARKESMRGMHANGENWLIKKLLRQKSNGSTINIIDVGCYHGDWLNNVLSVTKENSQQELRIYAFEPNDYLYNILREKFKSFDFVKIYDLAVSNFKGKSFFYIANKLGGTNSLILNDHVTTREVKVLTLDHFLTKNHIDNVCLIKTDTEGNDFNVLLGASDALDKGLIDLWQFEYNHRWIFARHFLKDVFDFIEGKQYLIGKLYENGIELYDHWHPELETFFESNFILVKKGSAIESLCSKVRFNNKNTLICNAD